MLQEGSRAVKIGAILTVVIGIGVMALAMTSFGARLQAPFHLLPISATDPLVNPDSAEALLQSQKDTDQDGISDVQELRVYGTSPFLADSDSDGIPDKEEIVKGTDPNCPEGTDCRAFLFPSARAREQGEIVKSLYESTVSAKIAAGGIPGLTDPKTLRTILRQSGISEEVLSKIDDATLVRLVQNPKAVGGGSAPAQIGGSSVTTPQALPNNPTAQEIRDLLIKSGADKTLIAKFSDEQLVAVYKTTLAGMEKKQPSSSPAQTGQPSP